MNHRQFKRFVVYAGVFFTSAFGCGYSTYLDMQEQVRHEERDLQQRYDLREAIAKFCIERPNASICKGRPGPPGVPGLADPPVED